MQPTTTAEVFDWAKTHHGYLCQQLRDSKEQWKRLPDGEQKQEAARNNAILSWQVLLLRDLGRFLLGRSVDDDNDPFEGPINMTPNQVQNSGCGEWIQ